MVLEAHNETIGRRFKEESGLLSPFEVDVFRLKTSEALSGLGFKTQVFFKPNNIHVKNRLSHTEDVVSKASYVARSLNLNKDLSEAIAYAHDIGHSPIGHFAERFLSRKLEGGFNHSINSTNIVQFIERDGKGLNLCYETIEGILAHNKQGRKFIPKERLEMMPHEFEVVYQSDKIAYTMADFYDFLRLALIERDFFNYYMNELNVYSKDSSPQEMLRKADKKILTSLISESKDKQKISFSESDEANVFGRIKKYLGLIYPKLDDEIMDTARLTKTYVYLKNEVDLGGLNPIIALTLLTDDEIITIAENRIQSNNSTLIKNSSFYETITGLKNSDFDLSKIDPSKPDLDWRNDAYK